MHPAESPVEGPQAQPRPAAVAFLRWGVIALSVLMVLLFLLSAKLRLHYAYSYNENGMLDSVRHIRAGLPLYTAPDVHFTPFLYTPIYFYAAAFAARFTGASFVTLRLVSIASTCGVFALLYALVYRESRRAGAAEGSAKPTAAVAALAAVGCFASSYPLVLEWFDVGRVDMLYLFFLMAAMYVSRPGLSRPGARGPLAAVFAGLLWVCAFQTKQGVLPIALLALAYDYRQPRRIAAGLVAFFAGLAASFAYLQHTSHGWYRVYVFGLAGGFGYNVREGLRFLPTDVLGAYGVALLVALAAALLAPPRWRSPRTLFYAFGCVSMILFTGYIRGHRGAGPNALLPAYLWIAVLFGVSLARLGARLQHRSSYSQAALALLYSAALIQLAMRVYVPDKFVPAPAEVAQRDAFENQLRAIPGDVMVAAFPELAVQAGKSSYADMDATGAVIEANNQTYGAPLLAQYAELIDSGRLSAVVTDRPASFFLAIPRVWMPSDFLSRYPLMVPAAESAGLIDYQPHYIYLPCSQAAVAHKLDRTVDLAACGK